MDIIIPNQGHNAPRISSEIIPEQCPFCFHFSCMSHWKHETQKGLVCRNCGAVGVESDEPLRGIEYEGSTENEEGNL